MKRLLLILCVLGFANLSQAQTKEETIAWIKEKFEKYHKIQGYTKENYDGSYDELTYSLVITPCRIELRYGVKEDKYEINRTTTYGYITEISFNPNASKWGISDDDVVIAEKDVVLYDYKHFFSKTTQKGYVNLIPDFDYKEEANLAERMAKALNHLATFCEETKNEAF
ncbi:hypothetical protein [Weeksella sp. HMSC059D05]|uniref:hypothetical protein n=1 Tax=Weeksella sp. HMSC059D05 TaxID=1715139 RepID=UPI0008A44961|nr:hypothetical protein [Weeksella sp. HMSC059D05]OFM81178.1 hypothetical protein HMPREF2660_00850 [Weeksella sp. HMSC059D05]